MKPSIHEVARDLPGRLFILPKPSGDRLAADLAHIRGLGVDRLVSLLEPDEASDLGLAAEAQAAARAGLRFVQHPVADYGLPDPAPFEALAAELTRAIAAGEGVAAHCRAGIGRSGMLTALILAPFAGSAEAAMARVSAARNMPTPDTEAQRRYIVDAAPRLIRP
ncbi:MAG: sulfur transferase domain-containing protein [Pseudomonadota bacterium]